MRRIPQYHLWVLSLVLLLALGLVVGGIRRQKMMADPLPGVTPCIALTGERDYRMEVLTGPPPRVQAGEKLVIVFTGGYYDVLPACEQQGGQFVYHYPTIAELAKYSRTVTVYLGQQALASVECGYECRIEFSFPLDLAAGMHKLIVRPSSWQYTPREAEFVIEVAPPA